MLPPLQQSLGDFVPVQIVGKATVDGREVQQVASTRDMLQAKWPLLIHPPQWHDGLLCVAVGDQHEQLFSTSTETRTVYVPTCTGKSEFSIAVKREKKGVNDPLIVALEGLPSNVTYSVKTAGKVPNEKYQVAIAAARDVPVGTYPLRIVSYGELDASGYQDIINDIPLRVVNPLTVELQPTRIVAGEKAISG